MVFPGRGFNELIALTERTPLTGTVAECCLVTARRASLFTGLGCEPSRGADFDCLLAASSIPGNRVKTAASSRAVDNNQR